MKRRKIWALFLTLALTVSVLSGCGGSPSNNDGGNDSGAEGVAAGDESSDQRDEAADKESPNYAASPENNGENTAMGRYVETVADLSEFCSRVSGVTRMEDGSLVVTDCNGTQMISKDNGTEWEPDRISWFQELDIQYVFDLAFGPDGTAGIIYKPEGEESSDAESHSEEDAGEEASEQEESDISEDYWSDAKCLVIKPDGTRVPVESSGSGEEWEPENIFISDAGKVFITTLNGVIYEVGEDGGAAKILTVEKRPEQVCFQGNLMIMDAERYDGFLLYDLEKKEYVEDEILHDFVQENYKDRSYSSADAFEIVFFPGDDGVLYIAGEKGLHRHVIGGSVMEQVIDGSLSCFGNPSYSHSLIEMTALPDNEFLAVFYGGKAAHFVYNPDIPTVPNERLKVYSLKENDTIRQGISIYQANNPEVYVDYEVGMEESDSIIRDDALKKLNTQIMAGEGPDVIILDNMPVDSYIEKNLLLDLSDCLGSLKGEDALFQNIVDAFRVDGKVYTVPCEIQLPLMAGKEKYISMAKDLQGIADMMEQIREDHPEKPLLRICSEKGIMRFFAMTSVPAWKNESGGLDTEAVKEFLKQTKRIYDAQMEGLPAQYVEDYMNSNVNYSSYFGGSREDSDYFRTPDEMGYLSGETQIAFGTTYYHSGICEMFSIKKVEGFEEDVILPMSGMSTNVFIPKTMIGINAGSSNIETAGEMVKTLLGNESQSNLYYGFSVNKGAFPKMYDINEDWINEEGVFSSIGSSSPDGKSFHMEIYILSEEQRQTVQEWMETVSTPYLEDTVLESAVYNIGIEYFRDIISLDEAVETIAQSVEIYLSE